MAEERPPICDYEGSDYQARFWDQGGRGYEDGAEAVALRRLLPGGGRRMLDVGAGAGRNTPRYRGFEEVVLLDYSRSQLEQAREQLGDGPEYVYVAADVYRLPFAPAVFDAATMIRVLHHMADPERALSQIAGTLARRAVFVLEFANKRNLKAVARFVAHRQVWSPFTLDPVEFAPLNFDFHPRAVWGWLRAAGFEPGRVLTVSHFRAPVFKRLVPARLLIWMDSLAQPTGAWWQLSPSVFVRSTATGGAPLDASRPIFRCPGCGGLGLVSESRGLRCPDCERVWGLRNGIYDFKSPAAGPPLGSSSGGGGAS